jgi:hypothetical protein
MPSITFDSGYDAWDAMWEGRYKDVSEEVIDTWRWGNVVEKIVRDTKTEKLYRIIFRDSVEHQVEEREDFPIDWPEVEPYEVTVTKYRPVGDKHE